MAEVQIKINNKTYRIGCDPGEEERVIELASHIDQQVLSLNNGAQNTNDAHLLVLSHIIMCDELLELKEMVNHAQAQYQAVSQKLEDVTEQLDIERNQNTMTATESADNIDDPEIADVIAKLANRIEAIADRMQKP